MVWAEIAEVRRGKSTPRNGQVVFQSRRVIIELAYRMQTGLAVFREPAFNDNGLS